MSKPTLIVMSILSNEKGGIKATLPAFAVGIMMVLPMLFWDYGEPQYTNLRQAEKVVRHISSRQHLEESSFANIEGEESPSEFVNWMFSSLGSAEWHVSEDSSEFSADETSAVQKTMPLLPKNVAIVSTRPKFTRGQQVVVKADDRRRVLIAEAYTKPNRKPVFVSEWPFPELEE